MKNAVVVEAFSTGRNYIEDLTKRGFNPIALEILPFKTAESRQYQIEWREASYSHIKANYQLIHECERYEDTVELLKSLDPEIVIPGAEPGVELATRLADSLGLKGNPYSNIDKMTRKECMHEALKNAGIRYIKGKTVSSIEEALKFYDELGKKDVVVKHPRGACSRGVHLCHSKEEMLNALNIELNNTNIYGNIQEKILIQELIGGKEYIVNTASCNGEHRITSVATYDKVEVAGGGNAYRYGETVDAFTADINELLEYALAVTDAIGIKYGPVHGEYKIDENGPVLIEVNCRPMGADMPGDFLDRVYGHHETDAALDCYLNPEKFKEDKKKPFKCFAKSYLKYIILPKDMEIVSSPITAILPKLRSYYTESVRNADDCTFLPRTIDLETSPGTVYLLNKDYEQAKADCELLCKIEKDCPDLLYQEKKNISKSDIRRLKTNITNELGMLNLSGNCPVIDETTDIKSSEIYDGLILDFSPFLKYDDFALYCEYFFDCINQVKKGGKVIVSKNTYSSLSNGRECFEILMQLADVTVENKNGSDGNLIIGKLL